LRNAHSDIDWWQNRSTYSPTAWSDGTACDDSKDIATKATEFIGNYSNSSFYLFVYFGAPDCSGHAGGDDSVNYNNSFFNIDDGLGILLDSLDDNNVSDDVQILVTADHGWNDGTTNHGTANWDTIVLPLITNNASMVLNETDDGIREQCEIAPTVLDYFGLPASNYSDIVANGCDSMISIIDNSAPLISVVSSSVSSSGATITWTTDESSNSSVDYGSSLSLGSASSSSDFVLSHSIALSGLSASSLYYYNVTSCDSSGNCANASGSFTTSAADSPGDSSPGGSSPSGSSPSGSSASSSTTTDDVPIPEVFEVSSAEVSTGYTKSLKKDEKVNFSIFDSDGARHLLTVNEIGVDYVNLTIESDPVNFKLGVGQSVKFNLTSADYYDLMVKLNSITNDSAELTIQLIDEPIEKVVEKFLDGEIVETVRVVIKDYFWVVIVLAVVLVAIVYVVIKNGKAKKLKGSKAKKKNGKRKKAEA
jgi:hypothetical protein